MAKDTYDYEGGKFSDDLDYDDGSGPPPKGALGKTRRAVTDIAGGAYDGFFNSFKDTSKWKDAVVDELPKQHKYIYDTYESVVATGDELYDQFVKETRPVLGEISKKLDDMVGEGSMFKGITQKLKDKFYDAPQRGGPGEESILEDALSKVMTETFGGIDMLQQQREEKEEKRRTVKDVAEQKMGQHQHEELMNAIKPMAIGISRLDMFKTQIESKFQKKQLELAFRTMMLQGRSYEHQKKAHLELMDVLKTTMTNTGLPEYAKIERGEKFKEMLRDRAFGGVQNALFGEDSPMGTMMKKFRHDIKDGIGKFTMALQGAAMGVDSAGAMFGKDSPMSVWESLGSMAGGELGGKARSAFIKPLMDELKKNPDFQAKGHDMAQLLQDPRLIIDLLKDTDFYKNLTSGSNGMTVEDIVARFQSYLKPGFNLGSFGSGVEGLHKPAIHTEKLNRVQMDVIPGYLARILQQVTSTNTLAPAQMLVYDYGSNSFVARSSMLNKVSKHLQEYNEKSSYTRSAHSSAESLFAELGLKEEDKEALAAALSVMAKSDNAMNGGDIKRFDGYAAATEDEKRILEVINNFAGMKKGEKISSIMSKVRGSVNDLKVNGDNNRAMLNKLYEEGHAELLEELGIVGIDKDNPGVYKTRRDPLEKLQRDAIRKRPYVPEPTEGVGAKESELSLEEMTTDPLNRPSDVNLKSGIRKIDKNKALRGIRNTPISHWNYKDGLKHGRKRHIGPMAQDVHKQFGDDMAPDGKELDLVNMNGAAMAAIQKIAEDQERLATSDQGSIYLKAIAKAVGAGETNIIADSKFTAVDYLKLLTDQVSKTNYLLENNRLMVSIPGIDFSKFNLEMPDIDLEKIKENGKKFVDPLIKTGNQYIDTIQSMMFSAIRDGFEMGKVGVEKGKEGLKTGKKWFFDAPANWLMEVLMRNEKEIKDKREWLYKKSVEAAGNAIDFGMSVITEKIPSAIKSTFAFLKGIKEGVKRIVNPPRDIYVKGSTEPVMQAETMRRQGYVDENNKAIRGIDDLLTATGSIRNIHTGRVVLTQTQLSEGVFDQEGNQLRTTRALGLGLVGGAAQAIGRAAVGATKWLSEGTSFIDKGKEAFNSVKSGIGNFFSGGFNIGAFGTDARLLRMTAQIRDLLAFDKPRKLVTQVYKRDLYKHPLEGKEFIASLYGKKFAERLFKKTKGGAKVGVDPSTGISTSRDLIDPNSPNPAVKDDDLGLMGNIKKAFSGYDKGKTFGQNMAAAMGRMGKKDPAEVEAAFKEAKDAVKEAANKSKTFNFFKDIIGKAKTDYDAEQALGPDGKKPGRWSRGKAAIGGLFKKRPKTEEDLEAERKDADDARTYDPDEETKKGFFGRGKERVSNLFKRKKNEAFDSGDVPSFKRGRTATPKGGAGFTVGEDGVAVPRGTINEESGPSSDFIMQGNGTATVRTRGRRGNRSLPNYTQEPAGLLPYYPTNTSTDVVPYQETPLAAQDSFVGPMPDTRKKGMFGRLADKVKNNKYVKRTNRNIGKAIDIGGRMGLGGILGSVASGIGGLLLGSSKDGPVAGADISGEGLHKEGPAKEYATFAENKTGRATFYDVNGDGVRDNGSSKQLVAQDQHRKAVRDEENAKIKESQERSVALLDDRKKKDDDFLSKMMGAVGSMFTFLRSGFGPVLKMLGGMGKFLGGAGKLAGKALGIGKKAVGGIFRAGGRAIGGSIAKVGLRATAVRGLTGLAMAGLAGGGAAGTALGAVAFAARLALGPVGWGLMAAQVAWWAGKKIYKYVKRNDVDDFGRIRMYQYGLTDADKESFNKFLGLEEYLKEHISWQGDAPSINMRSAKQEEIFEIFGIEKEDAEGAEKLAAWMEDRFKPFFYNALASVKFADPKANFLDTSKMDAKQLEALCSKLEFCAGPYDADTSPFKGGQPLPNTFTDVKKLLVVLKNSVPYKKENKLIGSDKTLKAVNAIQKKDAIAQEQDLIEKQRAADKEKADADKEKNQAENERKKLLAKMDTRTSDADRAKMALESAAQGRSLASSYRDETNALIRGNELIKPPGEVNNSGPNANQALNPKTGKPDTNFGQAPVSDDGGKEPVTPTEPTTTQPDQPAVTALPTASGPPMSPSTGIGAMTLGKGVKIEGLNPEVSTAFQSMAGEYKEATGKKLGVSDGYRSYAEQARLYATMEKGRAAEPGFSMHEFGAALDIPPVDAGQLEKLGLLRKYGFTRPVGGEPWHIEPAGLQGSLPRARKDGNFISEMMVASYGRGGGGIGIKPGVRKYSRNDNYAKKLFSEGSSTVVDLPKKDAANDPSMTSSTTSALPTPAPGTKVGTITQFGEPYKAPVSDDGGKEPPKPTSNASVASADSPEKGIKVPEQDLSKMSNYETKSSMLGRNDPNWQPYPTEKPATPVTPAYSPKGVTFNEDKPSAKKGENPYGDITKTKSLIAKYAGEVGRDPGFMQVVAGLESSMGTNMVPHMGGAEGPYQFMPKTWNEQVGRYGKKHNITPGTPPVDLRAATVLAGEYFKANEGPIKRIRGDRFNMVDSYLTHMLGPGNSKTFAGLKDDEIAATKMPRAARYNRNVFFDKSGRAYSAGEIRKLQMDKINRVAGEYGINMGGLVSNFKPPQAAANDEAQDSPGPVANSTTPPANVSGGGELGVGYPSKPSAVSSGVKANTPAIESKANAQIEASVGLAEEKRQLESMPKYTGPQPEVITKPTAVQVNQDGVSGLRDVVAASSKSSDELVTITRDQVVPLLEKIDASLVKLYELNGKGSGQSSSAPRGNEGVINPSSALSRNRKYGT